MTRPLRATSETLYPLRLSSETCSPLAPAAEAWVDAGDEPEPDRRTASDDTAALKVRSGSVGSPSYETPEGLQAG